MENIITKTIKFIAVYARVSTSNQEDQKTIEVQLSVVRDFAQEHGYIILKEYIDEGWSGDILARPMLDQLRFDARNREFDAILIYDPDRLARRGAWQELVKEELLELGIDTLFVTVPPPKNDEDIIMYKMRGVFAEYEKMKIKERFRIGKVNRVRNGNVLTTEGPYGYNYILNKGKKGTPEYVIGHFEINEREAEIVRKMFSWVGNDRMTLRCVVKKLHELGVMPRKSKREFWNVSTLTTLLRNKVYIGQYHWGASYAVVPEHPLKFDKYRKVKKSSRKMKPESQWIAANIPVPAILEDKSLFDRTKEQLRTNFATLGRGKKHSYLLSGKIFCPCGKRRTGEGPQRGKFLYYRCTDRVYSFPLPRSCKEHAINARIADEAVWQRLKTIMSSPKLLHEQIEKWSGKEGNKNFDSTINIKSTEEEIEKLKKQESRIADLYAKEKISLEEFENFVAPIRKKIGEFKDQIVKANLEKTPKNAIMLPSGNEIETFAREVVQYLENPNFETKQMIIRSALSQATAWHRSLQTYGVLNLGEIYVKLQTEYRNCRPTKCWKIDIV